MGDISLYLNTNKIEYAKDGRLVLGITRFVGVEDTRNRPIVVDFHIHGDTTRSEMYDRIKFLNGFLEKEEIHIDHIYIHRYGCAIFNLCYKMRKSPIVDKVYLCTSSSDEKTILYEEEDANNITE